MKPIARLGDTATCPGCEPRTPVQIIKVLTNRSFSGNRPIATIGSLLSRCAAVTVEGSQTVFVENRPVHRLGDRNSCGGATFTGNTQTLVG